MDRIVSLLPAATEIVCSLGFESQLVGRSHECDFPESVKNLPVCTEPKIPLEGKSAEIDRSIEGLVKKALSVYNVDAEKLKQLRPEMIVTQTQCQVCAVSESELERAVNRTFSPRPRIVTLKGQRLGEVWDDIRFIAKVLGAVPRGEEVVKALARRMTEISAKILSEAKRGTEKPTVACIEWVEPLMAAGNWVPELVHMAGGVSVFGKPGKHSPSLTWEELVKANPEVIVVVPCGFDVQRTLKEMPVLTQKPEWAALKAVKGKRVFVCNGNQYFNRPGPRLVESLEILAELLHRDKFDPKHRGTGWVALHEVVGH